MLRFSRPVFYDKARTFYVWGEIDGDKEALSVDLDDNIYPFRYGKTITLEKGIIDERALGFVISDVERLNLKEVTNWKRKLVKENSLHFDGGRFGEIYLIPFLLRGVFKKRGRYLLQLDFRLRMQPRKTVHELLNERVVTPEELKLFRFRPKGFSGTLELLELRKASEFPPEFFLKKERTATREISKKWWRRLAENEKLRRQTWLMEFEKGYIYPAQIVHLSLSLEDLTDEVELSTITQKWRMNPIDRWRLIEELFHLHKRILAPYGIDLKNERVFADGLVDYHREVVDAAGQRADIVNSAYSFLRICKPFLKKDKISVSLLFLDKNSKPQKFNARRKELIKETLEFIRDKGLAVKLEAFKRFVGDIATLKREFLKNIPSFERSDIVFVFFDEGRKPSDFVESSLYQLVKGKLLERNIPTQFVNNETVKRWSDYIKLNVAEQILAKTGNVPYKLSKKLDGVDVFIGLDISRLRRKNNTVNAGVFTKFFFSDGSFVRYFIQGGQTFGEKLTGQFIEALFQKLAELKVREGSRLVIHRDGRVWEEELELFQRFANEYGYGLELFEVIKRNNPRFFAFGRSLLKGHWLRLDGERAVVATYDVKLGTHQPVLVRKVVGELDIERAVSHLLSFTLLNYSSFRPIRLPATVHYADKISTMVAKNIVPSNREGEIMFWL
jgi:argonaute-like protein implicated in RNA metabolism and viral defense